MTEMNQRKGKAISRLAGARSLTVAAYILENKAHVHTQEVAFHKAVCTASFLLEIHMVCI